MEEMDIHEGLSNFLACKLEALSMGKRRETPLLAAGGNGR